MTREQQVKKIGDWMLAYRDANNLTQAELSEIVGVSPSTISRFETYEATPTKWMARKLQGFIDGQSFQSEPEAREQNESDMQRAALAIYDTVGEIKAIKFIAGEFDAVADEDIERALDLLTGEQNSLNVSFYEYSRLLAFSALYIELLYRRQRREQV